MILKKQPPRGFPSIISQNSWKNFCAGVSFYSKRACGDIVVFLWNLQNILEQLLQKHVNNLEQWTNWISALVVLQSPRKNTKLFALMTSTDRLSWKFHSWNSNLCGYNVCRLHYGGWKPPFLFFFCFIFFLFPFLETKQIIKNKIMITKKLMIVIIQ